MKILVVGHSIAHPRQRQMWKYIAKQGHKVLLVFPNCVDEGKYQEEVDGNFQLLPLDIYTSQYPSFWFIPGIHEIIQKMNPDIIFCMQEPWEFQSFELANLAELYNIPFGFFSWENLLKVFPFPQNRMDHKTIQVSDLSIGGNYEAAKLLAMKGARNVNIQLQTGLDPDTFFPDPKIILGHTDKPVRLLFIGRLIKAKGIGVLLQAMNMLDEKYILRIVGGRGEEDVIEAIKTHPLFGKRITIEEWVDYEKTPEIYNWADLTLVPSIDTEFWKEQCGYVIGESLLCGTPVITSASSSIIQIWGEAPDVIFASQGDVGTLVDFIESFTPFEAKKGREWVEQKISYKTIGDDYIKMLEEIV